MWNQTRYDFGKVLPNTKIEALFVYSGNKEIKEIKASCGCTTTKEKKDDNGYVSIIAEYITGKIAPHLNTDTQKVSKGITVTFTDNTTQILVIEGLIVKNTKI